MRRFVKHNQMTIIAFLVSAATFLVVFKLYSVHMEPVLYAFGLTLLWLTAYGFLHHEGMLRRHRQLSDLRNHDEVELQQLPEPDSLIEEDYQELLFKLNDSRREALSKADKLHTDMTNYYSLWAHQIKTPISAMRLVLENQEDEELSEQLFKIEQYVEMVLQYLRVGDISSDLVIRECNLDDIVRQAVRKYRRIFIRKKLRLDYEELGCTVLTDEKWLTYVVEQLLSNALKYTNEGTISVYMDKVNPKTLVIEDTGIGIKAEDLPRVFEKGFTGFNGRADKKSTGIGLFLCKQIMDKLKHQIRMESEPGTGTRVKLGLQEDKLWVE